MMQTHHVLAGLAFLVSSTGFAYAVTSTAEGDQTSGFPRTVFTAPDGLTTVSEFDRRGNLRHFTNKRDETFAFQYDGLGRQTSVATPLDLAAGRALTTTYTHRGAPLTVTEPSGDVTTFNYHPTNGRLTSVADNVGTISYTYDNNGNPLTVAEGSDTITRTYDRLGRVLGYTDENNQTIGYRYYDSGRLQKLIYPGGNETTGNVEYTYWQTGRLKNVIERLGATPRTSTFYWNNDGRLARIERPNGTKRVITYDAAGRPQLIQELKSNNAVIASFDISYYDSDEIYQLAISPSIDPAQFNAPPSVALTFNADNQIATFEIPWLNGELPGDGTQVVRHDADGNMIEGPNVNGEMTNYAYDTRNRLTGFDGYSYTYDAEDERVSVTGNGETTTFVNDPHNGLTRMLRRTKNGTTTRYVYGLGLLYEVDASGNAVYYHYDQSGSTIALTNQSQTVIEELRYSPYGEILYRESNYDTPFLFTGFFGNYTDTSGLIHMRARYYHPLIKRFINADPAQDGWNWYAYAAGNPLMFVDPSGLGNDSVLDALQTGLGALGMVPVLGAVADVANAGISAARGNFFDAGLNLAAAIPGFGDAIGGAKLAGAGLLATVRFADEAADAAQAIHRGSRSFRGTSHVYAIRAPDGSVYKVGKSSTGFRLSDGASRRAEAQVRRLNRQHWDNGGIGVYRSEIRRVFDSSGAALDYERRLRNTFRRIYGPNTLPGNREYMRWISSLIGG